MAPGETRRHQSLPFRTLFHSSTSGTRRAAFQPSSLSKNHESGFWILDSGTGSAVSCFQVQTVRSWSDSCFFAPSKPNTRISSHCVNHGQRGRKMASGFFDSFLCSDSRPLKRASSWSDRDGMGGGEWRRVNESTTPCSLCCRSGIGRLIPYLYLHLPHLNFVVFHLPHHHQSFLLLDNYFSTVSSV